MAKARKKAELDWDITVQPVLDGHPHGDTFTVRWPDAFVRDRHPGHGQSTLQNIAWDLARPLAKAKLIGDRRRKNFG